MAQDDQTREGVRRRSFLKYVAATFSTAAMPELLGACSPDGVPAAEGSAASAVTFDGVPAITVVRPDDLVSLTLQFLNLRCDSASHTLTRASGGDAYIAVTFPPQHIAEDALLTGQTVGSTNYGQPQGTRIAGPSRVVFKVPSTFTSAPYTLDAVLALCAESTTAVAVNALSTTGVSTAGTSPVKPGTGETALEIPSRLLVSPTEQAMWAHASTPVTSPAGRTELWHSRMALRSPSGAPDEKTRVGRTMRALWTRDTDGASPAQQAVNEVMTPSVRTSLVNDTSNFGATWQPSPLSVDRVILTPLGATFDVTASFKYDRTLASYTQHVALGRDQFIEVISYGRVLPFGHPAVCAKITVRNTDPNQGSVGALYTWITLTISDPTCTFDSRSDAALKQLLRFPFVSAELLSKSITCMLYDPSQGGVNLKQGWVVPPSGGSTPILVPALAKHRRKQPVRFTTPLLYVPDTVTGPGDVTGPIQMWNAANVTYSFDGQRIAYADSKRDDTSYETQSFGLQLEAPTDGSPVTAPNVVPCAQNLAIAVEAIRHLTGSQSASTTFSFHPSYASFGLDDASNNPSELLFTASSALAMSFSKQAQKSGGFLAPDMNITALSRKHGPVSGDPLGDIAKGAFTPTDFFNAIGGALPQLFGCMPLTSIVMATPVGPLVQNAEGQLENLAARYMPKIVTEALSDVEHLVAEAKKLGDELQSALDQATQFYATAQQQITDATIAINSIGTPSTAADVNTLAVQQQILAAATLASPQLAKIVAMIDPRQAGSALALMQAVMSDITSQNWQQLLGLPSPPPSGKGDLFALLDLVGQNGLLGLLSDGSLAKIVGGIQKTLATQVANVKAIVQDAQSFLDALQQAQQALEMARDLRVKVDWKPQIQTWVAPASLACFVPKSNQGLTLDIEVRAKARGNQAAGADVTCRLDQFGIGFGASTLQDSFVHLDFDHIQFSALAGKKPDVDVGFNGVHFGGPLSFVEGLRSLIPLQGFSDPPNLSITDQGIDASYSVALPNLAVGMFSMENMSLAARLTIPFLGNNPLKFTFDFCTKENPFTVTVAMLGGGGFFGLVLTPTSMMVEASVEVCAQLAVNLGVAAGCVSIAAGVYFSYDTTTGVTISGYLRIRGQMSILGLITITVELRMELTYSDGKVIGRASIMIEIDLTFFSKTVEIDCERKFAGSNGDPTFAELMEPTPTFDPLADYCMAFA